MQGSTSEYDNLKKPVALKIEKGAGDLLYKTFGKLSKLFLN
jgi:hypothetical protein